MRDGVILCMMRKHKKSQESRSQSLRLYKNVVLGTIFWHHLNI